MSKQSKSEEVSFYRVNYNGTDVSDSIMSEGINYTIRNGVMKLYQGGKQVDSMNIKDGTHVQIRCADNSTAKIIPLSESAINEGEDMSDIGTMSTVACEDDETSEEPDKEENALGGMLPQVGLNGVPMQGDGVTNNFAEVLTKDMKDTPTTIKFDDFDECVLHYIEDPYASYTDEVNESVQDKVLNLKTKINISRKTRKLLLDSALLKSKIKIAEKTNANEGKIIELKRELIRKQKELNSIKQSATSTERAEIQRMQKAIAQYVDEQKPDDEKKNITEHVEDSDNVYNESIGIGKSGRIRYWEQMADAIKEKLDKATSEEEKAKLQKKLIEYNNKVISIKNGEPKKEFTGIGLRGKMHSTYRTASTDDIIQTDDTNHILCTEKTTAEKYEEAKTLFESTGDVRYEKKMRGLAYLMEKENTSVTTEAANMEDEIKPLVEKLNKKGFKVKYSSPGHKNLRKKEDREPDGVYNGCLYSDARIMFQDDYKFPKAPKYWKWRIVDGCDYLDIIPHKYDESEGTPDEAFAKWKDNYMDSLATWIDELGENDSKPKSENSEKEEEVEESVNDMYNAFLDNMIEL